MTQEEKAKAYDEALDWMREIYPTMEGIVKEDAEHYFPELKEYDDDLAKEINAIHERYPEISFAKLSRICVRIANWQKNKL